MIENFENFQLLLEEEDKRRQLATLKNKLDIVIDLEGTVHMDDRSYRHGAHNVIEDEEIISDIRKAIPEICDFQLKDIDRLGKKYWVRNNRSKLNSIAQFLRRRDNDDLFIRVITIMRKDSFIGDRESRKIDVN